MTPEEAASLLALRQVLWPNTPAAADAESEAVTWALILDRFDVETVAAVMRLKRAEAFAPTVGQIEEAINPTPTYAGAMEEFKAQMRAGYSPLYSPPESVPWSHPLTRAFACAGWWYEFGMSPDASSDPEVIQAEAAFRAHFREGFKGVAARHIAEVELPALVAGTRQQIAASPQPQIEGD